MIRIGDLSKITRVPVKTLRYYDEMNLLKPVQVDPFTNYRYYSAGQIPRLHRILALKELGLSLEQISHLLDDGLPAEQMVGILRQKEAELSEEVNEQQERLTRVRERLKQFEKEKNMSSSLEVVIKSIPEMRVASVRGVVPTYPAQGELWDILETAIKKANLKITGPCFTIDHDPEYKDTDHDLEVCEPVSTDAALEPPAQVRLLPAVESMACAIHNGSFLELPTSYDAVLAWIDQHGYQICGVGREIYLKTSDTVVRQDDPGYVIEIQFPVKKGK